MTAVRMAMESEPPSRPPGHGDVVFRDLQRGISKDRMHDLLRNYRALGTRASTNDGPRADKPPKHRPVRDSEKDRIDTKAMVDAAFLRLTNEDPVAAALIYTYYMQEPPPIVTLRRDEDGWSKRAQRESERQWSRRAERIAAEEGMAIRTFYYRVARGVKRMSRYTGWQGGEGE